MDIDLIVTVVHHLAVFTVVGIVAAEFALLRPGLSAAPLLRLAKIDQAYGEAARLVVLAGVARVMFGRTEATYYLTNPIF